MTQDEQDLITYLIKENYFLYTEKKTNPDKRVSDLIKILPSCLLQQAEKTGKQINAALKPKTKQHIRFLIKALRKLPYHTRKNIVKYDLSTGQTSQIITHKIYTALTAAVSPNEKSELAILEDVQDAMFSAVSCPFAQQTKTPEGRKALYQNLYKAIQTTTSLLDADFQAVCHLICEPDNVMDRVKRHLRIGRHLFYIQGYDENHPYQSNKPKQRGE